MKNQLIFLLCCCALLHSIAAKPAPHGITTTISTPAVAAAPTYTVAVTPVVTAHSHQVVARHYNGGLYVPAGYASASYVPAAYPSYTYSSLYPYPATSYRYGYGYYPAYGYSYGYGTAVPAALWR
ncbi:cuticle protein 63 isoform X1 [Zeugodacus cucurbitae]|uniref:cuticle protein 63 isoform X1 n=1 Tax=Zeugodacus cucurbitae TaxID=28588 RepID=UPI000596918C|nr:cuticle protein 63 isoform X1 [Zeugodacus cucurbitae]